MSWGFRCDRAYAENSYVEDLIANSSECDYIQREGILKGDLVKMKTLE